MADAANACRTPTNAQVRQAPSEKNLHFYSMKRIVKKDKSRRLSCTDSRVSRFDRNDYDEVTKNVRELQKD